MSPLRRPMWPLQGHLGASVSALVDGQLDEVSTERAWQHVVVCAGCRRLVEHESWLKRQLGQIGETPRAQEPSDRFLGSLLDLDPAVVAWAETQEIEDRGRTRRRVGIALVGAGSVAAAVLGLSTLGGAPLGGGASPATSVGQSRTTSTPTRAVVTPTAAVSGTLPGWTVGSRTGGVVHARAVGDRR
ncbi:MAG: hypothetical protein ABI776_05905 [Nocardioidaceae bacterium]